jgi:hypothetical protein
MRSAEIIRFGVLSLGLFPQLSGKTTAKPNAERKTAKTNLHVQCEKR